MQQLPETIFYFNLYISEAYLKCVELRGKSAPHPFEEGL